MSRTDPIGVVSFPPVLEANCFQRMLYDALGEHGYAVVPGHFKAGWLARNRGRARVLHFHWPEAWYRHYPSPRGPLTWLKVALFVARLAAARALGYRIAWTVHEVFPLNGGGDRVDRVALGSLARASRVLMANDEQTAERAVAELGDAAKKVAVVPHSSYVGAYPEGRLRADVRDELGAGPDTTVFLLFGHLSAYKRIEWFVDAFRAAALPDAMLVVAGLVMDEGAGAAVEAAAAEDDRVKALLEFIPDERVSELFAATDVAVCPRQDGGTSAVLLLAMSMGVAPLTAAVPTYEALTGGDEAAWLFAANDHNSFIEALHRACADPQGSAERGARGLERMAGLSWESMARRAAELLDATLDRPWPIVQARPSQSAPTRT